MYTCIIVYATGVPHPFYVENYYCYSFWWYWRAKIRFSDALEDASTGLTYAALTGQNKQSVRENWRGCYGVYEELWIWRKICVSGNWRWTGDEHGLSELQQSHNYDMLNFLLDELLTWHKENYNLSTLKVNQYVYLILTYRSISNVRGFT